MADDKPMPPNLDLINMVQRARMLHDREAVPSSMSAVYWIESKPLNDAPSPTTRAGEWIIETNTAEVDTLWAKIRQATEAGLLGYKSKVSTSAAKDQSHAAARVIIVRTVDADAVADVARVEAVLRELGVDAMRYARVSEG